MRPHRHLGLYCENTVVKAERKRKREREAEGNIGDNEIPIHVSLSRTQFSLPFLRYLILEREGDRETESGNGPAKHSSHKCNGMVYARDFRR